MFLFDLIVGQSTKDTLFLQLFLDGGVSMWGFIIAIISGTLMSIQGVFNTGVMKQTSVWVSASFVQATALLVCLFAWFLTDKENSFMALFKIDQKYMLLGGIMGAFITITVIQSIKTLGPARSALLIVVAQLFIAYLIELFGIFGVEKVPFDMRKLVGFLVTIVGVIIFKWK